MTCIIIIVEPRWLWCDLNRKVMIICNHSSHWCCFSIIISAVFETKLMGMFAMCMLNITTYKITVTRIASRMIPVIRPPMNAPASPLVSVELSHEGVQTWLTVAVAPPIWIKASAPLMSAQFLSVVIMSVAVMSPLLLEYATVVVKVALVPSPEHVSWESSRLTEVKLQEHWSRTTPERLSSSDWVLFCSSVSWKSDKGCLWDTVRVQAEPVYYGHVTLWPPHVCCVPALLSFG